AALVGTLAFGVLGGRLPWRWLLVAGLLVQPLEYWVQAAAAPVGLVAAAIAVAALVALLVGSVSDSVMRATPLPVLLMRAAGTKRAAAPAADTARA
ncbi:MAG: hypothetical protein ACLGHP_09850, partial [Vicinamibacteria bacterium]